MKRLSGILAAVLTLLLAAAPAWGVESVSVRAAEHDRDGYGRIAFDWPAPVEYQATLEGDVLKVHFARPFQAKLDPVLRHLDRYIAAIALGEDGSSVVARLKRSATVHSFADGNVVAIDIIAGDPAAAVSAAPRPGARKTQARSAAHSRAQPAAVEPTAPMSEGETIAIRFGEHDGYRRLVFDWHASVPYTLSEKEGVAKLDFGRAAKLDAARLSALLPDLAPAVEEREGGVTLRLAAPAGTSFRYFRSGNSIVLDVAGKTAPAARASTVVPPPELIEPAAGPPEDAKKQPVGVPRPLIRPSAAIPPPPGSLPVHYVLAPQGASLRFDWSKPTAAAVFRRGSMLWIVFEGATPLDLTEPLRATDGLIASIDPLPAAKATVLRLVPRDGVNPSVRRVDNAWIVELRPQQAHAEAPIAVEVHPEAETPDVLFGVREAGEPLWLRDPEVGDMLAVVPVGALGRGVGEEQDFVDFVTLPSVQGIALRPNADDLAVARADAGVQVTRPGGLLLSAAADRQLAHEAKGMSRLFDFAGWKGPADQTLPQKRSRLERVVAAAPVEFRSKPRLALARFYFANLYAPEAEGVLDAIRRDDPAFAAEPPVLLLTGAVHLLAGEQKSAVQELGQQTLEGDPEALLWRASLSAELGDWNVAAHGFSLAANLLPRYPARLRFRFALQAAQDFIETAQPGEAQVMTQLVLKSDPPVADRAMALYLEGRRSLAEGEYNRAIELWKEAAELDDRPSRALALYARTAAELDAKRIDRASAIKELDRLRFAWRGDAFEFGLLRKLAALKLADGDQRGAFDAWREAATNFAEIPQAKDVARELTDAVADVFLGKGIENVPPLKALALYEEFKEYVPAGERSDAMVRRLVDRLVAVDLLDRWRRCSRTR